MTIDEDPALTGDDDAGEAPTSDAERAPERGDLAAAVEPPQTGDPALEEMLGALALAQASAIPLEDRLPVIEAVHRGLQDRLADVED